MGTIYLLFVVIFTKFYFKFAAAISQPHYDYIPSLENYVVVSFSILVLLASGVFATTTIIITMN